MAPEERSEETSSVVPALPAFPSTHWSILSGARSRTDPRWHASLNELARLYWKPIYRYIRARWGRPIEEAKDLTQEFFLFVMEGEVVKKFAHRSPRFRTYVKACLENFLRQEFRDTRRLKRGGGEPILSLDFAGLEERPAMAADERSPDEVLDGEWRRAVLDQAIQRLHDAYENEGRPVVFEAFRRYALVDAGSARPSYQDLARELAISETDVGNHLTHARRRLGQLIRQIIAETVSGPEALEEEFRELMGPPRQDDRPS